MKQKTEGEIYWEGYEKGVSCTLRILGKSLNDKVLGKIILEKIRSEIRFNVRERLKEKGENSPNSELWKH